MDTKQAHQTKELCSICLQPLTFPYGQNHGNKLPQLPINSLILDIIIKKIQDYKLKCNLFTTRDRSWALHSIQVIIFIDFLF